LGSRVQTITLSPIGNYQYLFFVKELIDEGAFKERKKNDIAKNLLMINTDLHISLYVGELKYPVFIKHRLPVPRKDNLEDVLNEDNLAYLIFCIDARTSLLTDKLDKFWIQKIKDFSKQSGQEFPNSAFCGKYALNS
jgi:hypothetical protein